MQIYKNIRQRIAKANNDKIPVDGKQARPNPPSQVLQLNDSQVAHNIVRRVSEKMYLA